MRFFIEYYVVKTFLLLTKLLPNHAVYAICKALARLLFAIDSRRSILTLKNLTLAFPNMGEVNRLELAKKTYESVAISVAEIFLIFHNKIDIDSLIENKQEALTSLKPLLEDLTKGKLVLTAHFGNWELLAQFLAKHNYPMIVIGRKGDNALIEERITKHFRNLYGNTLVQKNKAMSAIIRAFIQKKTAGMLIDQKAGGLNSIKTTFFGHPVDTVNSTALLIERYSPIVVPIFLARQKNGNYKLVIKPSHDKEANHTEALTQYYNNIIEEVIRDYPEQWFWMHNRWNLKK